jgi:hypothetical protein
MISTELFPYENHPYRLEFGEKKNPTICFFSCEQHLDKYLERYKLDKRTLKIDYRDGKPVDTSKKRKGSVEQKPKPKSKGSSGTSKGRKPSVDSSSNTTRTPKSKK